MFLPAPSSLIRRMAAISCRSPYSCEYIIGGSALPPEADIRSGFKFLARSW